MANVILGHPYSGALYGYFSDQIGGEYSHTFAAEHHSYYRTLYGSNYKSYVELALTFLLLYDRLWLTPADTHIPRSRANPHDSAFIVELGLHADWQEFLAVDPEQLDYAKRYLEDAQLRALLGSFGFPRSSWEMIVESACYEAGLSVRHRVPLLCFPGRRALIRRVIEIDRPALYPIMPSLHEVQFIESYKSLTGMALYPKSLDDLMVAKPDKAVRSYGERFLTVALEESTPPGAPDTARVATLIREAIETQRISSLYAGALKWAATFFRVTNIPGLGTASSLGASGASYIGDRAGWHEFSGSINAAINRAELLRRIEDAERNASRSRYC